ncbi:MAG: hypothetical protein QM401_03540 [Bacillota bacterium]|nr:hypothetical protein [Bacillota bacterium]
MKISGKRKGVSNGQVVLLFEHTAKRTAKLGKYEFKFSESCPIGGVDLNWKVGPPVKR